MRRPLILLITLVTAADMFAADQSPKDVVAALYKAHGSKHDPLEKTELLSRYFDPELVKLYLRDQREAKGEVGRLDGDPLYNAQETQITDFSISAPTSKENTSSVTVRFKNIGKATRVEYVLSRTANGWRIADIRYDDGSSLKKILQGKL